LSVPRVSPDGLKATYWKTIDDRLAAALKRIIERQDATSHGRIIPEDEHLVIGEGRHLKGAVLITDISKFSAWPSGTYAQQADVLNVLNFDVSEMVRVIRDYGGEVEKNTGDGLMAYFDAQPGEGDEGICKRALAAALTMRASTDHIINPVIRRSGWNDIKFRAGIDFGPITIARIGAAQLFNSRVAIGATANIASKILSHAGDDDIVIGNDLREGLPAAWAQHAHLLTANSGFVYTATQTPYALYEYRGRWTSLV
jgi:adenylate cyclase